MKKAKASSASSPAPESASTLDDVLISLQKSFSRVSARSSEVAPENARSLIVGNVNFELTLRLSPDKDTLLHKPEGELQLKLSGVIQQDIRAVHVEATAEPVADSGVPQGPV
jgi:hypothetical protein